MIKEGCDLAGVFQLIVIMGIMHRENPGCGQQSSNVLPMLFEG